VFSVNVSGGMKHREGQKSKHLSVRLSLAEWDFLRTQADESGMVMSDFVRSRIGVGAVKENKKEYRKKNKKECWEVAAQIARVGDNVSQLAKWVNAYKSAADAARVIMLLSAALTKLEKIRAMMGE